MCSVCSNSKLDDGPDALGNLEDTVGGGRAIEGFVGKHDVTDETRISLGSEWSVRGDAKVQAWQKLDVWMARVVLEGQLHLYLVEVVGVGLVVTLLVILDIGETALAILGASVLGSLVVVLGIAADGDALVCALGVSASISALLSDKQWKC